MGTDYPQLIIQQPSINPSLLFRNKMPKVYVIGVGMTKFIKPGSKDNADYPDMAKEAGFLFIFLIHLSI